ncbi:MAG TPA: hypothetical protein EYH07_02480 [Kiloniellaceae bacterium]|nr:hypothetical protein [Kiloniellaceae bacterium]
MIDPKGGKGRITRFRRVLVVLDSAAGGEVLKAAAGLASAESCELTGLFVEDQDLLRLAALPFAREVQLSKAITRALEPELIERDLQAQASQAKAAIARQAELHRLAWSFHMVRGRTEEQILLAASAGDIIAMARRVGPLASYASVSRQARKIAARAPGPLLLAGDREPVTPGTVLLPYDASPAAEFMLGLASNLAEVRQEPLEIMLLGEQARGLENIEERIRSATGRSQTPPLRVWIPRDKATATHRLCDLDRGLLVLPADLSWFEAGQVERILEEIRVPVVLQTEREPQP